MFASKFRFLLLLPLVMFLEQGLMAVHWQPAETLGQSSSRFPDVAVDPNGNSVAVWIFHDGVQSYAHAATKPANGSWSSPVSLSTYEQRAEQVRVAMDQKGNAIAVWTMMDENYSVVQSAYLPAGASSWIQADSPLSGAVLMRSYPKVHVDNHGNAMAIWGVKYGETIAIQSARLPVGMTTWSTMHDLLQVSSDVDYLDTVLDDTGNAVAVWQSQGDRYFRIYASTLPSVSHTWSEPVALSSGDYLAIDAQVVVDDQGNALAAWREINDSIKTARLPFRGKEWQQLLFPEIDSTSFELTVNTAGDACLVWESWMASNIQYSLLSKGGTAWSAPADVTPVGDVAVNPSVRLDSKGNAFAIWQNNTLGALQGAALPYGNKGWSSPRTIARVPDLSLSNGRPALALMPEGSALVVFPTPDAVKAAWGMKLYHPDKTFKVCKNCDTLVKSPQPPNKYKIPAVSGTKKHRTKQG